MTQAAVQLMHDLLAKSAETGKTEFDPFDFLGTPESVLDELERSGYVARSKTIRRKIILTDLALHGKEPLQAAVADENNKRRKPRSTHSSQEDNNLSKKSLHWTIAGVIVAAVIGILTILVTIVIWRLSQPRP